MTCLFVFELLDCYLLHLLTCVNNSIRANGVKSSYFQDRHYIACNCTSLFNGLYLGGLSKPRSTNYSYQSRSGMFTSGAFGSGIRSDVEGFEGFGKPGEL